MKKLMTILLLLAVFVLSGCYSCKSFHSWKGTGPVPPEAAHKVFWSKDCRPIAKVEVAPAPPKPKLEPMSECGPYIVSRTHPCRECGIVKLEKNMPKEVQLNGSFDYSIKVTNLTDSMVTDVVVTENLPEKFELESASPTAKKDGDKVIWTFDSLGPGKSRQITVTGKATDGACVGNCATVQYLVPACAYAKVVQPKLNLAKTAPSEVLLCDPIPVKFRVTNNGSGSTQNVRIVDTLPAGLRTTDGKSTVTFSAGTLTPGQSKEFSTTLKASKTGEYINKAVASAAGGLKSEATTKTVVRQAVLTIAKTGQKLQFLGRTISYEITVTNKGDAPATNTVINDTIPSGVTAVRPSSGGTVSGSKVVWNVGTVPVNGSRKVSVSYTPSRAGTFANTATATAKCADGVTASARTSVKGIPAVLLEVVDLVDPVEVGTQTTYLIIATNQGSSPGTNIRITCTWEDSEQYISSSGDTKGSVKGNTVTFAPLPSLAPKAKATWRVVVKAVKQDDTRFKVSMNTDEFERPVEETEATNLYK